MLPIDDTPFVASLPKPPLRDFPEVQAGLEDIVSRLHKALDPKTRVTLLRDLRTLLEEAASVLGLEVKKERL